MPVYFLPSTPEEDELASYLMEDRQKPCWLCRRESRKTPGGYMCWECHESRPIWEAHIRVIREAQYAHKAAAYAGMCKSCAVIRVVGDFECEACREERK